MIKSKGGLISWQYLLAIIIAAILVIFFFTWYANIDLSETFGGFFDKFKW